VGDGFSFCDSLGDGGHYLSLSILYLLGKEEEEGKDVHD
jgi:hypothetical protein